ncbi:hypothetical protein [Rhizobium sp. LCM 4573]|uniref:hypothetical protein n=1 Tax=Rhizobium sp. LCM 4573 TaxID=1848291 RepID=UPI001FCD9FDF|nr:hypothetical protein [Rhizobium sp. LCM 4573]
MLAGSRSGVLPLPPRFFLSRIEAMILAGRVSPFFRMTVITFADAQKYRRFGPPGQQFRI